MYACCFEVSEVVTVVSYVCYVVPGLVVIVYVVQVDVRVQEYV